MQDWGLMRKVTSVFLKYLRVGVSSAHRGTRRTILLHVAPPGQRRFVCDDGIILY